MKKILKFFIAIVSISFIFSASYMPTAMCAEDTKLSAYEAYYDYIENKMSTFGYYSSEQYMAETNITGEAFFDKEGLIYARLIDFDSDGLQELFTIEIKKIVEENNNFNYKSERYTEFYSVFTFREGKLVELANEKDFLLLGTYCGFCIDGDGKSYFFIDDTVYRNKYFSVRDGKWVCEYKTDATFIPSWSESYNINGKKYNISSNRGEYIYYIDNYKTKSSEYVTFDEYTKFVEFKKEKLYEKYDFKLNLFPDYTPHAVLQQLKEYVPNYAAHYWKPSDWANEAVNKAVEKGYVEVNLRKKYTTPITRAEFCSLATNFYEKITKKEITERVIFHDTEDHNVGKMAYMGVVSGVGDGYFKPDELLTREMAAVILSRLANIMDIPLKNATINFSDNDKIASWASMYVGMMQNAGIMQGIDGNKFAPHDYYTREQSIITFERIENSFIKAEKIELSKSMSLLRDKTYPTPIVTFYPNNTTDKNIIWSSSDTSILTVDNSKNTMAGIKEGTTTLTAKTRNGVYATCVVTIEPYYANLKTPIGTELNILSNRNGIRTYDYIPENPIVSSKIKLLDVADNISKDKNAVTVTLKLTEITEGYDDDLSDFFKPYIKWQLTDESNNIVENGVAVVPVKKINEEITIEIPFKKAMSKNKYYLEFANDSGENFNPLQNKPKVKVSGLPLQIQGEEGWGDDVEEVSMKINSADIEIKYNANNDSYQMEVFLCGYTDAEHSWTVESRDFNFGWVFTDSSNEEIESKDYDNIDSSYVEDDGSFRSTSDSLYFLCDIELDANETYYLKFFKES